LRIHPANAITPAIIFQVKESLACRGANKARAVIVEVEHDWGTLATFAAFTATTYATTSYTAAAYTAANYTTASCTAVNNGYSNSVNICSACSAASISR
jgi:hypothetical protein